MGMIVRRFFDEAEQAAGIVGKMRLAYLTRVTSTQAASIEDTPDVLARFEEAMVRLQQELGTSVPREPTSGMSFRRPSPRLLDDASTLRRRMKSLQDLLNQRALFLGDVSETSRRVTESASSCLDVERVSVWLLDSGKTKIRCLDLFVRTASSHTAGTELFAQDFPAYFKALETERTIAANDAHVDSRTSCFSEVYLRPLGIGAMLDVPIWAHGKMVGVLCHEHVGEQRPWTEDDETFASSLGALVALALERQR